MTTVVIGQPPDAPVDALVLGFVVVRITTFVGTAGKRTRAGSAWAAPLTASTRVAYSSSEDSVTPSDVERVSYAPAARA
jgi:hypothetical protein